jgi:hypothetical protein
MSFALFYPSYELKRVEKISIMATSDLYQKIQHAHSCRAVELDEILSP